MHKHGIKKDYSEKWKISVSENMKYDTLKSRIILLFMFALCFHVVKNNVNLIFLKITRYLLQKIKDSSVFSFKILFYRCTYSSERSLNDDNFFSFKTKLMIMFIFMTLKI